MAKQNAATVDTDLTKERFSIMEMEISELKMELQESNTRIQALQAGLEVVTLQLQEASKKSGMVLPQEVFDRIPANEIYLSALNAAIQGFIQKNQNPYSLKEERNVYSLADLALSVANTVLGRYIEHHQG